MISVLFVCLGNICRSPMAEAIFRDLAAKKGLEGKLKNKLIQSFVPSLYRTKFGILEYVE